MSDGTGGQNEKGRAPDFKSGSMDESRVRELAERLAQGTSGGEIFLLEGPLGAGKTFFTRSFAAGLGILSGITSPTYMLHCEHQTPRGLLMHHLDFYRLSDEREVEDLGIEELCHSGSVVVAEWPDRCPDAFEAFTLRLRFIVVDESHRKLEGWWGDLPFDRSSVHKLFPAPAQPWDRDETNRSLSSGS